MWAAVLRRSEECRKDWSASSAGTDLTVLVQTPTVLHASTVAQCLAVCSQ